MAYIEDTMVNGQRHDYRDKNAVHTDQLLDMVYPIGALYLSTVNTSPENLFGGEWERISDKFLLAGDTKWQPGSSGGYADAQLPTHKHTATGTSSSAGAHTHTVNSSGAHTHSMNNIWSDGSGSKSAYTMSSKRSLTTRKTASAGSHNHTMGSSGAHTHPINITVANAGSAATDKNLPPYLSVYVWKRVR